MFLIETPMTLSLLDFVHGFVLVAFRISDIFASFQKKCLVLPKQKVELPFSVFDHIMLCLFSKFKKTHFL